MDENTDKLQNLIDTLSDRNSVELDRDDIIKYLVELKQLQANQLHKKRVDSTAKLACDVITRKEPNRISYNNAKTTKKNDGINLTFDRSCEFPNVEPNPTYHVNYRIKGFNINTIKSFVSIMSEMFAEAFKYVPRLRRPSAYFIFQILNNGTDCASTQAVDVESTRIEESINTLYEKFDELIEKIEKRNEAYENIIIKDSISYVRFFFKVKYFPEPKCIDNWGNDINSVEKCHLFDIFTANNKNERCIIQCARRIWGENAKEDCIAEIIKRSNNKLCILQPRSHVKNVFNINSYSNLIVDPLSPIKKFNVIDPDIVYLIHWRGHIGVLENMKQQKRNQFRTSFRPLQKYPNCDNITVCFDIECYFDPYSKNGGTRHIPYLCCACFIYDEPINSASQSRKSNVGNVIEFEGCDCVAQMIDWSAELAEQFGHKSIELIAHNGGGYDFHYILSSIYDPGVVKDILIRNNNFISFKFKHMDINFSVKDSLNFLLCSLSSAAKAFLAGGPTGTSLSDQDSKAKTDFPHHEVRSKEDLQRTFQKWISIDNIVDINTEKEKMLITSKHFINYSKDKESRKLIEWAKEYCCNDVVVLSMVWSKFKQTVADIFNCHIVNQTYTLAGLSFRLFEAHLPHDIYLVHPVKEDFINMRKALIGGRCISTNGMYENIACLDVKSLYPAAMAFYDQPYGKYFKVKKRNPNELGIYYIKVEPINVENHGFFPLKNERNEVSYKGEIKTYKGWYTTVDIDIGIQEGHKIEYIPFNTCNNCYINVPCSICREKQGKEVFQCTIHKDTQTCAHGHVGYSWRDKGKIFKEYITNVLYKLKIQYEQEGNKEKRQVIKIIMNSLWGKFAQKWMDTKYKIVLEENANLKKDECYKIWDTDHMLVKNYRETIYSKKPVQNGVFTLSWARWHMKLLWDAMTSKDHLGKEIPVKLRAKMLYSDTDSIMVQERMINEKALFDLDGQTISVIGDNVGQLEIEYIFDELICVGRKQYMGKYYKNGIPQYKLRFKGVPKQHIKPHMYTHLLNNPNNKVQVDFLKFKREWGAVHGYMESKTLTQT